MKLSRTRLPNPAIIFRQLSNMFAAGLPITRCFEILEQTQHENFRAGLSHIRRQLMAGNSLHDSLRTQPQWFDVMTCSLIHLGEQTGKMQSVLQSLAAYHENNIALKRSLRQALFYPAIILITAILLTTCMFIFIIPVFATLFHDMDKPLPWLTRAIFYIASIFSKLLPIVFFILIPLVIYCWRKKIRHIPLLTSHLQAFALIRFLRNLSLALTAGMPILEALQLTAAACGHPVFISASRHLRASLSAGNSFYHAITTLPIFPVIVQHMIRTGEESGTLDKMLDKAADILEIELNSRIFHFLKLLEPLIMSVLGVLIGSLVIGMYLPVFYLGSAL